MKHNFKPETFVNGTPEECELMLKALEIAGFPVFKDVFDSSNHVWFNSQNQCRASSSHSRKTHELSQSELYEITRPEYWCVSREEITDEFKDWFIEVSNSKHWTFDFCEYGYSGRRDYNGFDNYPFDINESDVKQIPIALWHKWFYEPWLEKEQQLDFGILNETDVFFVELKCGSKWLFQGNNLTEEGHGTSISLATGGVYDGGTMCKSESIKTIRKATPEEIEPYKHHFKLAEPNPEFDPSLPFEVSDDGIEWKKFGDMYVGSDLRNSCPYVVSTGARFEFFKHIRNIQPTEVNLSEIEAIQVNGELITNFKIVNE